MTSARRHAEILSRPDNASFEALAFATENGWTGSTTDRSGNAANGVQMCARWVAHVSDLRA